MKAKSASLLIWSSSFEPAKVLLLVIVMDELLDEGDWFVLERPDAVIDTTEDEDEDGLMLDEDDEPPNMRLGNPIDLSIDFFDCICSFNILMDRST